MFAAILTSVLFAFSGACGARTTNYLGSLSANFWRLLFAFVLLVALSVGLGASFQEQGTGFSWLLWSGVIGFGFGDIVLYVAFAKLGSRLTILLVFATAPIFAALGEWGWLGVSLAPLELAAGAMVMLGLIIALLPKRGSRELQTISAAGVVCAVLAGLGQGAGAVLSRKANALGLGDVAEGGFVEGITQATVRVGAGLILAALAYLLWVLWKRAKGSSTTSPRSWAVVAPWLMAAGLFGPVLGVSCFQWALLTIPGGITLAVVACAPLFVMPLARILEGDRFGASALLGTVVAVAGVAMLALVRG